MNFSALLANVLQDLRYGARLLSLNKAFFAVATLSLALGIGANTAIFQLIDAVRLSALPVTHPEQLVELRIAESEHCCNGNFSSRHSNFTSAQWEEIRRRAQGFSDIFAWADHRFNLTEGGEVHYAEGLWISGEFFNALGVRPALGRLLSPADDHPGCGSPAAVISYAFWQREFAGDGSVLSKTILLDGHRVNISGVTPPGFFGVEIGRNFDVAVPICAEPLIRGENSHLAKRNHCWLAIIGRLRPGWTLSTANAQAQAMSSAVFANTVPPNYRPDVVKWYTAYKLTALSARAGVSDLRKQYEAPLSLLLGIAAFVLLIACSNLANLLLARGATRQREMAIRLAIGAGRGRLIRQLMAECFLLTAVGSAAGTLLATFLSRYLILFLATTDNPLFIQLSPDWRVLAFTAAVATITCLLFGLTPALRSAQVAPATAMKSGGRGTTSESERFGLRRALVITQVALSLVLLVIALLFVRTLRNLLTLDAGFRETGLLITSIDISRLSIPPAQRSHLYAELLESVRGAPGVQHAATADIVQIGGDFWNENIEIIGRKSNKRLVPWFDRVSSGYFETMGTPLIAGRDFDARDTINAPPVAIVTHEFSTQYLGGANPIGREFRIIAGPGERSELYQIVGMVENSKYGSLREKPRGIVFVAAMQNAEPQLGTYILTRSNAPLGSLTNAVRRAILHQNAEISLQFQSFEAQLRDSLLREGLMATLSSFFAFLAAALATVGLYGVVAYMVERRRTEIGVRIALGADRNTVLKMVMSEAGALLTAGIVAGGLLSALASRTAESLLFGLRPSDPVSIVVAMFGLTTVALLASFIPAFRASQMDPMTALREE